MHTASLARRGTAEAIGTALLVATVVGSGIMAERLAGGNVAVALLANTLATAGGLIAFILAFGPVSGAHFNPAVTLVDAWQGGIAWNEVPTYIIAQVVGGVIGVVVANLMFDLPAINISQRDRSGASGLLAEFIATFGLLSVIWGCVKRRPDVVPFAVAAYIAAAYWFTSSTSFANPAVTIARTLSNSFAGIRPSDVPAFILVQIAGAFAATLLFKWLVPTLAESADSVVVPSADDGKGRGGR